MSRRRGPFLPLLSLALCVLGVWMFLAPNLTHRRIQKAAERGDVAALEEMVDFPALRVSVKENVQTTVARGISRDEGNAFAAIGGMLAGAVVRPLVDAAVTPAGIASLMRGQEPARDGKPRKDEPRRTVEKGYEGFSRWAASYRDPETGEETVAVILRRDGLRWKLAGVRFGPDVR